jgi:S-DNA-T family DNA segregation ATPase FtsK/SpoIIIE
MSLMRGLSFAPPRLAPGVSLMWTRRQWRLDVAAGGLFLLGLLAALAVISYDPADVDQLAQPPNPVPHNLLGRPGAWLGHGLTETLGVAVYALLAGWFVLVVLLLLRRGWFAWSRRLCGWLLLVPSVALLADRCGTAGPAASLLGPGGSLGAWLAAVLEQSGSPLQLVILAAGLTLGVVLALDFTVRPGLRWGWWGARQGASLLFPLVSRPRRRIPVRRESKAAASDDSELTTADLTEDADEEAVDLGSPVTDVPTEPRTIPIHHHDALLNQDSPSGTKLHLQLNNAKSEQERFADYQLPPLSLLENSQPPSYENQDQQLRDRAALLEKTFTDFGINVRVVGIHTGPVITQFEVALETGLRLNRVTRLADDIALNLSAASVRMVAPIPGRNTVGIEIPNEHRADVRLKEVMLASSKIIAKSKLPLFIGKDAEGRPLVYDLADMPHLLIAGTTGTGKSVCMNTLILSILMTRRPDEVKLVMIDPKGGVELDCYARIPHLMHPVIADVKKAEAVLGWAVDKMEERYDLLRRARVRNIAAYNELSADELIKRVAPLDEEERRRLPTRLPYIVIVIDEMADLIVQMRKEVEGHIIRLAQKSRAAGVHLVVATQKPTVDVITGLIKSNLPSRICFKVASKSDSRVVLDEMGADKLLSRGDMLFLAPGTSTLIRAQGTYASDKEITAVVEALEGDPCYATELMQLKTRDENSEKGDMGERLRNDELYEPAVEIVIREGRGSVSLLQRALGIGYGRAARLIDYMAEDGIVGAYNGSNAREVLYTPEQWRELRERIKAE